MTSRLPGFGHDAQEPVEAPDVDIRPPEPGEFWLLVAGIGALVGLRRRRAGSSPRWQALAHGIATLRLQINTSS